MKIFQFQCGDEGSKTCTLRIYNCVQLQKNSRKPLQCKEICAFGEWKGAVLRTVHASGLVSLFGYGALLFYAKYEFKGLFLSLGETLFYYAVKGRGRKS